MTSLLDNIRVVLVATSHPGNIGGAARAMKNMGLTKLYLVQPKDFPADESVWRAASARDILDNAVVVDTLDEAIADCGFVVGTSARERRIPWPLIDARQCGERLIQEVSQHPVAILFGREDRGLTNEELQRCHCHVHIPANPEYSALNITMAVQVICYEIRMAWQATLDADVAFKAPDVAPARAGDMEMYLVHLEETLSHIGFIEADNPRQTMPRLRRLFLRAGLDQMELNILRGMLTSIRRHATKPQDDERSV